MPALPKKKPAPNAYLAHLMRTTGQRLSGGFIKDNHIIMLSADSDQEALRKLRKEIANEWGDANGNGGLIDYGLEARTGEQHGYFCDIRLVRITTKILVPHHEWLEEEKEARATERAAKVDTDERHEYQRLKAKFEGSHG